MGFGRALSRCGEDERELVINRPFLRSHKLSALTHARTLFAPALSPARLPTRIICSITCIYPPTDSYSTRNPRRAFRLPANTYARIIDFAAACSLAPVRLGPQPAPPRLCFAGAASSTRNTRNTRKPQSLTTALLHTVT